MGILYGWQDRTLTATGIQPLRPRSGSVNDITDFLNSVTVFQINVYNFSFVYSH